MSDGLPLTDEGLLAALRDAGWVDPEEAARLRERQAKTGRLLAAAIDAALVTGDDVTDWQRGYRACSDRVLAAVDALDQKAPETAPRATQSAEEGADAARGVGGAQGATGHTGGGDG